MSIFASPTLKQLGDAAEAALYDGRAAGHPDWDTRERFLQDAATLFDVGATLLPEVATSEDAKP